MRLLPPLKEGASSPRWPRSTTGALPGADLADIVFELYVFELALNLRRHLLRDWEAPARALAAMTATVHQNATAAGRRILKHEVSKG